MNKFRWIAVVLLAITTSLVASYAFSSISEGKQGIVRNQLLFDEFNGTKDLNRKLILMREGQQKVLDSIKFKLALAENQSILETLQREYAKTSEIFGNEGERASQEYTSQIWSQINEYLKAYGKENGYRYIIGATGDGGVMYASETIDITEEAIKYINRKYEGN
jgi:outer membrane protein